MNMKTRAAILFGIGFFLLQLVPAASTVLGALDPDIQDKINTAFTASLASPVLAVVAAWYLLLGIASHVLPMLLTARIFHDISKNRVTAGRHALPHATAYAALAFTALLLFVLNFLFFPNSRSVGDFDLLLTQPASRILLWGVPLIALTVVLYWLAISGKLARQVAAAIVIILVFAWSAPLLPAKNIGRSQPDIIMIGVDSLRADHLKAYGAAHSIAPNIDSFVANAVRFDRAYTPQARTFVAYTSILTGLYPTRHHARENLYPSGLIRHDTSVAENLRQAGYATLFAMDESRFANIGPEFGFTQVVAPAAGVLDFVIGSLLDTAGTNLLQLFPYSGVWMPHIAGNRAAAQIYRPDVFSRRLSQALRLQDSDKPLFLTVHFCIAHWPYAPPPAGLPEATGSLSDSFASYRAGLQIADDQVGRLLATLKRLGRLDNAIVVVLADHGEALGMAKDRWQVSASTSTPIRPVISGHGTPALDSAQSRVVLAFQRYLDGKALWAPTSTKATVSLVDIAPTLLFQARMALSDDFDGIPLLDTNGHIKKNIDRPIFIESALSGAAIEKSHVAIGEAAAQFAGMYRVTADGRLELRESAFPAILAMKQRAVVFHDTGVSSWPLPNGQAGCWLRVDLSERHASCGPLETHNGSTLDMISLICEHFAGDRKFVDSWCPAASTEASGSRPSNS